MRTTLKAIHYTYAEIIENNIKINAKPHNLEEPSDAIIIYLTLTPLTHATLKTPHKGSITPRKIFDLTSLTYLTDKPYWYQTGQIGMLEAGDTYFLEPMLPEDEPTIKTLFTEHL